MLYLMRVNMPIKLSQELLKKTSAGEVQTGNSSPKPYMKLYDGNVCMPKLLKSGNHTTATTYGGCLPFGLFYADILFRTGGNSKEHRKEKSKAVLTNYQKSGRSNNRFRTGWTSLA